MIMGDADNVMDILKNEHALVWKKVMDEVRLMHIGKGTMAVPERNWGIDIVAPPPPEVKIFNIESIHM
jgi:hypothetical protein